MKESPDSRRHSAGTPFTEGANKNTSERKNRKKNKAKQPQAAVDIIQGEFVITRRNNLAIARRRGTKNTTKKQRLKLDSDGQAYSAQGRFRLRRWRSGLIGQRRRAMRRN